MDGYDLWGMMRDELWVKILVKSGRVAGRSFIYIREQTWECIIGQQSGSCPFNWVKRTPTVQLTAVNGFRAAKNRVLVDFEIWFLWWVRSRKVRTRSRLTRELKFYLGTQTTTPVSDHLILLRWNLSSIIQTFAHRVPRGTATGRIPYRITDQD